MLVALPTEGEEAALNASICIATCVVSFAVSERHKDLEFFAFSV